MADESTTKLNIDISELKKNIQEANRLIRVANSEFKATSATMENWAKSADGITAKLSQLDKVLKSQETILDSLEKQYQAVAEEQGENSKGAQELLVKINNQKAAIAKTQSEIKKWKNALNDVNKEQDTAESATDDLSKAISEQEDDLVKLKKKYSDLVLTQGKSSKEAKETAKEISKLSAELNENKAALSKAEKSADSFDKSLDELEDSSKKVSDGFTVMKGVLADLVASGIKSVVGGLADLASSTREYREDMAKLKTGFETAGHSTETATKTYKDFYAVLGEEDRSVEAINHLAKMVDSEKDLETWTKICTGVWGTFGDSLPIEGLTEAANETAKVGQVTGPLADALNWAGKSEDEFNKQLEKCNSEQERQQLIMKTLDGLYSDAAANYRENNAEVMAANQAQSDLTDAYSKLGTTAEPILTVIKQGLADLLTAAIDLGDGVDFSSLTEKIKNGFGYLIDTVLPKVKEGFEWILDNKDEIIAGIVGIGTGFAAWSVVTTIQGIIGAIKKWTVATEGLTVAQKLLNLAQKANVIGIVIAAITALVAAFIYLWNTSDEFRAFWINLWEKIKEVAGNTVKAVSEFFVNCWKNIEEIWGSVKEFFVETWESIKETFSSVGEWFSGVFDAAKTAVEDAWNQVVTFFAETWEKIKTIWSNSAVGKFFSVIIESVVAIFKKCTEIIAKLFELAWALIKVAWSVVADWFKGVWEKIKKVFEPIVNWFKDKFQKAWDAIKNIWNKAKEFFSGIWEAIKKIFSDVASWFGKKFQSALDAVKNTWNKATSFFSGIWSKIKDTFSNVSSWFGEKFGAAWKAIKDKFANWGSFWSGLWTKVKNKFSDIGSNIGSAISDSIKSALNKVLSTIERTINKGIGLINSAIKLANKLPGINVGTISKISLPRLERGGILKKGQVGLLEGKGTEAVVPLDKNKLWIRKTAKEMSKEIQKQGLMTQGSRQQPTQVNQTFNQYNNSPRALSRLEIYRQTKNQLNFAKGV